MREITFRAWDKNGKGWVYLFIGKKIITKSWHRTRRDIKRYSLGEWLQYTGYRDSKGKEIYEGSICRYWMDSMWKVGVIIWHRGGWAIDIISMDGKSHRGVIFEFQSFIPVPCQGNEMGDQFDVVGSIHENPEIVKRSHHEKS